MLVKKIADILMPFLLKAFNNVLSNNENFPHDQKVTFVRLIPKKSNLSLISGWRPICIGNCIFKLYSKVLTKRLADIGAVSPKRR